MRHHEIETNGIRVHAVTSGPDDAPALVLLHALGTDLRIWDWMLPHLPAGLRVVRLDMRGHGLSEAPPAPYGMGALVSDAEGALDALGVREAAVLGLSIGGLIAQGLAVKRLDLVRAMILSNTGAKIGTRDMWESRIALARDGGLPAIADGTMERWFPEPFRSGPEGLLLRRLFERQTVAGWTGCAAAIAGTDFYTPTAGLRLPTLGIAADRDGSTPPDLVRETIGLVPGGQFHLIRGAGHIPCVDAAEEYAAAVTRFLAETGHLGA